jgi:hypothetical protein
MKGECTCQIVKKNKSCSVCTQRDSNESKFIVPWIDIIESGLHAGTVRFSIDIVVRFVRTSDCGNQYFF